MKKILSQILIVLVLGISIFAQDDKPILYDEFGPLALGDTSARLDGFRQEIRSKENSRGVIKIYGGANEELENPYIRKALYETYFLNFGNDRDKLTVQICDSDELEIRNQFFIVLPNTKIEDCSDGLIIPYRTRLIKTEDLYDNKDKKLLDTVDGYLGTKGVDKAISEASKNFPLELLNKSPDSKIYLIGYAGRYFKSTDDTESEIFSKADSLKVNDKKLKQIKNELIKKGIAPSRITTVRGGYSNYYRKIEYYFIPKNGAIPQPKPDYFPKKKRNK